MNRLAKSATTALGVAIGAVAGISAFAAFIIGMSYLMPVPLVFALTIALLAFGTTFWVVYNDDRAHMQ